MLWLCITLIGNKHGRSAALIDSNVIRADLGTFLVARRSVEPPERVVDGWYESVARILRLVLYSGCGKLTELFLFLMVDMSDILCITLFGHMHITK